MPIPKMIHPNSGFSFRPSIFLETAIPTKMPTTDKPVKPSRNPQSWLTISMVLMNPRIEFIEMIKSEVATAFFMCRPSSITSAGTIKNPPPAPINPVIIPTKSPCEIKMV